MGGGHPLDQGTRPPITDNGTNQCHVPPDVKRPRRTRPLYCDNPAKMQNLNAITKKGQTRVARLPSKRLAFVFLDVKNRKS